MDFKKRVNGSWADTPNYIHNTSTDTITTLPTDIYPTGTAATVGLKGNMEQNGTPTPDSPITPSECGDMSSNLWSHHPDTTSGGVRLLWDGEKINYSNTCTRSANSTMTIDLKKGTYTLKVNANRIPVKNDNSCIDVYHQSSGLFMRITNKDAVNGKVTFTLDDDLSNVSLRIRLNKGTNYDGFEIRPMLNIGETSLPYDVYGQYKIPISSANTATPIYLGEVETTRTIKKIVFVGSEDENWAGQPAGGDAIRFRYTLSNSVQADTEHLTSICTHLPLGVNGGTWNTGDIYTISSNYLWLRLDSNFTTVAALKSWLAQQYANGTPFTVYYTLAEPETAVVNEPLRKIGDYADTVSGITIPTIAGTNTIDVDTTLKPSEMSVNYKGWHPVSALHRFNGTSWD